MKLSIDTPTFRVLLSISFVWILILGLVSIQEFRQLDSLKTRIQKSSEFSECLDRGRYDSEAVESCEWSVTQGISRELDSDKNDTAMKGFRQTLLLPALIISIYIFRYYIADCLIYFIRKFRSATQAYMRWVRGTPQGSGDQPLPQGHESQSENNGC